MIFNEILIPQDSFTKTNVTRKRFIVENSYQPQIGSNYLKIYLMLKYA